MSPWKLESAFEKPFSGWNLNACTQVREKLSLFDGQVFMFLRFQPHGLYWEEGTLWSTAWELRATVQLIP